MSQAREVNWRGEAATLVVPRAPFINGGSVSPVTDRVFSLTNPVDGSAAGFFADCGEADVAAAAVVPARYDLVTDALLCTRLVNAEGTSVDTVEHVMAALAGTGVTDATVTLDGPEAPIADGSSAPFVSAILAAGLADLDAPLRAIRVLAPVRVEDGDRWAALIPAERFEMAFRIEFQDPAIGTQSHEMALVNGDFVRELCDCRTFGQLHEVERMRALGLARGGSLENAIVVDRGRVLNPDGLRRDDEFVRHKMLDAVGDLALAGAPIIGRYLGHKAGHRLTNRLAHALHATPEAWRWEKARPGQVPGGEVLELPEPRDARQAMVG